MCGLKKGYWYIEIVGKNAFCFIATLSLPSLDNWVLAYHSDSP